MSTEEHTAPEDTPDRGESNAPEDTAEPAGSGGEPGSREAARYRRALREAESERDALRARVESYQRAEVEHRLADTLEAPADVWLTGVQLADVLDEHGQVDTAALDRVALQVTTDHPGWRKQPGMVDDDQGQRTDQRPGLSWSQVIRGHA